MKSSAFSVFQNPQTQPQFLALANFFACLQHEKPRDFAFILSVLKNVQRWWLWWIRCIGHHKIFMDATGERGRKNETRFHMSADNLLPKFKRKPSSFLNANYPAIFSLILFYFWTHYSFEGCNNVTLVVDHKVNKNHSLKGLYHIDTEVRSILRSSWQTH